MTAVKIPAKRFIVQPDLSSGGQDYEVFDVRMQQVKCRGLDAGEANDTADRLNKQADEERQQILDEVNAPKEGKK